MKENIEYRETDFIGETAAAWFQRIHGGEISDEQQAEFDAWFAASPANANAYNAICAMWLEVGAYEKAARQAFDSVKKPSGQGKAASQVRSRWLLGAGAALAAILLFVPVINWLQPEAAGELYDTSRAQTASINLEDGSVVHLNAKTQVVANYSTDQRHILLKRGEALFDVASDKVRPFVVRAGSGQVQAVGTSFDINRVGAKTIVTILEGRVLISSINSDQAWSTYASAGEQVSYDSTSYQQISLGGSLQRFTAWRNGKLIFERKPLKEVVIEFNRFGKIPMVIADSRLEDILIDGSFDIHDTEALLRALEWIADIKVEKSAVPDYRLYRKSNYLR